MSDMKTFTVRDLDRSPSVVLEASRTDGRARIRQRDGVSYILTPEVDESQMGMISLPDFAARRKRLFKGVFSPATAGKFDKAIAGE